jgi:hypothetical protein
MRTQTRLLGRRDLPEVPVLTEQAVEGATGIEYGEIVETAFFASATDPVSHAIRRKRVSIPVQDASLGCSRQVDELPACHRPKTAEATFAFADLALAGTELALHAASSSWRRLRQSEDLSRFGVDFLREFHGFFRVSADAVEAQSQ